MFRTGAHLYLVPSGVTQTRKSKGGASVFALTQTKPPLCPLPCLAMGRLKVFDHESLRAPPVKSGSEDPFFIAENVREHFKIQIACENLIWHS